MIDLHQGFSGREPPRPSPVGARKGELHDVPPTLGTLAVVQLDAATALANGQLHRAARGQWAAARLLGQALARELGKRLSRA